MGSIMNEVLYKIDPPGMKMRKKSKVFVIESNGTYETNFYKLNEFGVLEIYSGEDNKKNNPTIISRDLIRREGKVFEQPVVGTRSGSTGQPAYIWWRGEKFAYPLANRNTSPRNEDEDTRSNNMFELGKEYMRKRLYNQKEGVQNDLKLVILILVVLSIVNVVMNWQVLGAL